MLPGRAHLQLWVSCTTHSKPALSSTLQEHRCPSVLRLLLLADVKQDFILILRMRKPKVLLFWLTELLPCSLQSLRPSLTVSRVAQRPWRQSCLVLNERATTAAPAGQLCPDICHHAAPGAAPCCGTAAVRAPPLLLALSPSGTDLRAALGCHRSWLLRARAGGDTGHENLCSCETFRWAGTVTVMPVWMSWETDS